MDHRPGSATRELLGELQIRDYLEIAWNRKWWIILTTIALSFASWVVAGRLPSIYSAQSVILIDPQKVPDSYVPSTISSSIADRLATMSARVLGDSAHSVSSSAERTQQRWRRLPTNSPQCLSKRT